LFNSKKIAIAIVSISAIVTACSSGAATTAPASVAPASVAPASVAPASVAPASVAPASAAAPTGSVALLLPENHTPRYEAADKPFFETKFAAVCAGVKETYSNAAESDTTQQSQAEAAITSGAKVLVLDPVNGATATAIMTNAAAKGVKVISYDRLITAPTTTPDWYISFDNEKVGQLQGTALLAKLDSLNLGRKANVVWINGSPKDNNATLFKKGAHSVLDGKVTIVVEDAMANWKQDEAQTIMDGAITKFGKTGFDAVYVANDGGAAGVYASMVSKGIDPKTKPMTGQDAAMDALQRIVLGQQYMTIYKAIQPEAEAAAMLACNLVKGDATVPAALADNSKTTVNNGTADIKSVLLNPLAVTIDGANSTLSIQASVVKDAFYGPTTAAQICDAKVTPTLPAACTAAGIK
jgi:D-xylose transport system substrate-binding protein